MRRLYQLGIYLYGLGLRIAVPFYPKARLWVSGRQGWYRRLQQAVAAQPGPWIWFHCASLGEFEQGRNLIEAIRRDYPDYRILLTFFSPSGYEIRKHYAQADLVCYLPLDTRRNARRWMELFELKLVFFIKYELWLHYLEALAQRQVPTLLVSARFDAHSPFVRSPLRNLYQQAFRSLTHIFTQDQATMDSLTENGVQHNVSVSGDTRFDRVSSNLQQWQEIPQIRDFKEERLCIMAGSSWPRDEAMLLEAFGQLTDELNLCLIIAPHEIHSEGIQRQVERHEEISLRFSTIGQLQARHRILWIDNIGMLAKLYAYADVAYVGGGWGTGLHNILEAAVFGCPVIFGPEHHKFPEAQALINSGGGFAIDNLEGLQNCLVRLLQNDQLRSDIGRTNKDFITQGAGATEKILSWCRHNGLLA